MNAIFAREIRELVAPPASPVGIPSAEQWVAFESWIGTRVPTDFRELVQTYGIGQFDQFMWLYSPIAEEPQFNLLYLMEDERGVLHDFREVGEHSQAVYPENNGLLPWTGTINGDTLFWRTTGAPDQWTVVLNPGRSFRYLEFAESASGLIYKLLTKAIQADDELPDDFPLPSHSFETLDQVRQRVEEESRRR